MDNRSQRNERIPGGEEDREQGEEAFGKETFEGRRRRTRGSSRCEESETGAEESPEDESGVRVLEVAGGEGRRRGGGSREEEGKYGAIERGATDRGRRSPPLTAAAGFLHGFATLLGLGASVML